MLRFAIGSMLLAGAPVVAAPKQFTPAQKTQIVAQIKDQLLDGDSAKWRWPAIMADDATYCGFFNAKNRMGGYTGFKPFMISYTIGKDGKAIVHLSYLSTDDPMAMPSFMAASLCKGAGYSLTDIPPE